MFLHFSSNTNKSGFETIRGGVHTRAGVKFAHSSGKQATFDAIISGLSGRWDVNEMLRLAPSGAEAHVAKTSEQKGGVRSIADDLLPKQTYYWYLLCGSNFGRF